MKSMNGKFRGSVEVPLRKQKRNVSVNEQEPEKSLALDTPIRVRVEARQAEERANQDRDNHERRGQYVELEKEAEAIVRVVLPRINQEHVRIEQKMEEQAIPPEEELRNRLEKAIGYGVLFLIFILSAFLLMWSALAASFYTWQIWERMILAVGFMLAPVIAFHLLTRKLPREEDGRSKFSLWMLAVFAFVVVLNMAVWMWVRGKYEPAHTRVATTEETGLPPQVIADSTYETQASQASESRNARKRIDQVMSFGHVVVGVALDSAAAVVGSFAFCLLFFNLPKLELYRVRESLEDDRDERNSRLIQLAIEMRELNMVSGMNEPNYGGK